MSTRGGGEANEATDLLYYRMDTARLCLSCDQEVHTTNTLFRKHMQSLLCDSERSALCHDCDWDHHHSTDTGPHHSRHLLDGFFGRPSPFELPRILGFDYLGWEKPDEEDDQLWETARVVEFDNLVISGSGMGFWVMADLVYFWV